MLGEPYMQQHEVAALHHDAASRTLAAQGHGRLGARQALRLSRTLRVDHKAAPASTSSLPRSALFGPPIGEPIRPAPTEKGVQKKQERHGHGAASTPSSAASDVTFDGPTYDSLSHVLPEWHEMQNRHCVGCCVPLLLGLNASFVGRAHGIVCRICATLTPVGQPSNAAKRALRSRNVRRAGAASRAEQPNVVMANKESEMEPRAASKQVVAEVSEPVRTLEERQAEIKRQAKKVKKSHVHQEPAAAADMDEVKDVRQTRTLLSEEAAAGGRDVKLGGVVEAQASSPSPLSDSNVEQSTKSGEATSASDPASSSAEPLPPSNGLSRLSSSRAPPSFAASGKLRGKKPADDKQALRNLLAANRKKKATKDQTESRKPTTGLQDFLGSL